MANKPGLLARVFGRSKSPIVSMLYTHAVGAPLLVHPAMGEQLIGAYLSGAVDLRPPLLQTEPPLSADSAVDPVQTKRTAILNISGALVSRPVPGLCDPGPLSYEFIASVFDRMVADDNVKAIVLRCDSPGGMAGGCFDLSDRIYAARGKKPVYAMVDNMAYSACYAIAAAADEIWLTRTGGVGSVGVVTYHCDQSAFNSKVGLKVTFVFSGDRKVDFNPHLPLSEDAQSRAQVEVDRLRALFVESVAKYRGLDAQAVFDTQADTYHGPGAVEARMADRVGTLSDLLAHIESGEDDEDVDESAVATTPAAAASVEAVPATVATAVEAVTNPRAALADALAASSLAPDLVKALLGMEMTVADIPVQMDRAGKIADLCAAAGLRECAAGYVTRGVDLEVARAELVAARADTGTQIVSSLPASIQGAGANVGLSTNQDIYSRRREAAAGNGK